MAVAAKFLSQRREIYFAVTAQGNIPSCRSETPYNTKRATPIRENMPNFSLQELRRRNIYREHLLSFELHFARLVGKSIANKREIFRIYRPLFLYACELCFVLHTRDYPIKLLEITKRNGGYKRTNFFPLWKLMFPNVIILNVGKETGKWRARMKIIPRYAGTGAVVIKHMLANCFNICFRTHMMIQYHQSLSASFYIKKDLFWITEINKIDNPAVQIIRCRIAVPKRDILRRIAEFLPCRVGRAEAVGTGGVVEDDGIFVHRRIVQRGAIQDSPSAKHFSSKMFAWAPPRYFACWQNIPPQEYFQFHTPCGRCWGR